MTLRQFIRQNREGIDDVINAVVYRHDGKGGPGTIPDPPPRRNDSERVEWVINDETLYRWAKENGVRL